MTDGSLKRRRIGPDSAFASDDIRSTTPRFAPEARTANQALVDLLSDMAHRKTPCPRVALAWLLAQKPLIVAIPGTRRPERLARLTYR